MKSFLLWQNSIKRMISKKIIAANNLWFETTIKIGGFAKDDTKTSLKPVWNCSGEKLLNF